MRLLARKPVQNVSFGAPYAVLNLSRVGLRYLRFMIKASPASRARLVNHFVNHPNVGWIFSAEGWFNLAVGVWVKDNAEINDLNSSLRSVLGPDDEIVYQSELTSLYSFANQPDGSRKALPIVDSVVSPVELDPLRLDYIKMLTLDSSLPDSEMAEVLSVDEERLRALRAELEASGVVVGYQERINYGGVYCKVFVDTLSARDASSEQKLVERLWADQQCIYLERANGKYNLEFELVLDSKSSLKQYLQEFSDHRTAILTENLYTNLYPLNKVANLKAIKDTLAEQSGEVIDFRNSKLWYLNYEGADAYLSIYENKRYFEAMNRSELDLFPEICDYIRREHPADAYSVVDIGSGDGLKARVLIEELGEESVKAYYPVDIQPIELATALKAHEEGKYAKSPVLLDLENLATRFPLKLHPNEGQIYAFLGGTYGNFKSSVINQYLKPLTTDPAAVVLVAMPIRSIEKTDQELIRLYRTKKVQDIAFGPLSQLGFSLDEFEPNAEDPDLKVHVAIEDARVVESFILAHERTIFGQTFQQGTCFKMMTSWKPTLEQVQDALAADFSIRQVFHNGEMSITAIGSK